MPHFRSLWNCGDVSIFDKRRSAPFALFAERRSNVFLPSWCENIFVCFWVVRGALSHKNHVNLLVSDAQILQTHGSESPGPSERKKFRVTRGCCCKLVCMCAVVGATHWAQLVFWLNTHTNRVHKFYRVAKQFLLTIQGGSFSLHYILAMKHRV